MSQIDGKLFFVLIFFASIFTAATVYIFKYHSDMNFATFMGGCATMGTIFHWICTYDDKHPDQHQ